MPWSLADYLLFWPFWRHVPQLSAAFDWVRTIVTSDDFILVQNEEQRVTFTYSFPVSQSSKPVRRAMLPGKAPRFILLITPSLTHKQAGYTAVFTSPAFSVLELQQTVSPTPIRFGLSPDERRALLAFTRTELTAFLNEGRRLDDEGAVPLFPRFGLRTSGDVSLWVDGFLRGSAVFERLPLGLGVAHAAVRAARDSRFRPLEKEELEKTRIEVVLFSDVRIPLTSLDSIYPEKGYEVANVSRTRRGYFLPEIHNVRTFKTPIELLEVLKHEKAKMDSNEKADVWIFDVEDFIESQDCSRALPLCGPVIAQDKHAAHDLRHLGLQAAQWLRGHLIPSDNSFSTYNPLTGVRRQIDWIRLAFSTLALHHFERMFGGKDDDYVERTYEYLCHHLLEEDLVMDNKSLALIYLGQLAYAVGDTSSGHRIMRRVIEQFNTIFDPITLAQCGVFLLNFPDENNNTERVGRISATLRREFEILIAENERFSLARWAELAHLFKRLGDEVYSLKVLEVLLKYQLPSGGFPNYADMAHGGLPYTRGTGKLFEVLALYPEQFAQPIEKTVSWLFRMQYDEENTFFVRKNEKENIIGGFRHDDLNPEVWIDAAGHVLMGAARMLEGTGQDNATHNNHRTGEKVVGRI